MTINIDSKLVPIGDQWLDPFTGKMYVFDGKRWVLITEFIENLIPTKEQLSTYPALNQAWEEYLIVRTLLGI